MTMSFAATAHMGPVPSPDDLAAYKDIDADLVPFFMDAARQERVHRHGREDRRDEAEIALKFGDQRRLLCGQVLGFAIFIAFAAVAMVAAIKGLSWPASIASGTALSALIGAFSLVVTGRRAEKNEHPHSAPTAPKSRLIGGRDTSE